MSQEEPINCVFVTTHSAMASTTGGVQLFTREVLATLENAGIKANVIRVDLDRSFKAKVSRKLMPRPYCNVLAKSTVKDILAEYLKTESLLILLNGVAFFEIVRELRDALPEAKIVLLSYGLESTDYLHELRAKGCAEAFANATRAEHLKLARQLTAECRSLRLIDGAICLSENEAEIKRWLGVQHSFWCPRSITPNPIPWSPVANRVGFVGTLDHPPNVEGLHLILRSLEKRKYPITVRLIGGPPSCGEAIRKRFQFVNYLGQIDDSELVSEAATWQAFLHPIFCYARGASTKLAVGLGWGIPVVATTAGRRGYEWSSGKLLQEDSVDGFVDTTWRICCDSTFRDHTRAQGDEIVRSSPTIITNSILLRHQLESIIR